MNISNSLFFFFFVQLSIVSIINAEVTADSKCINGRLNQFSDSYKCNCDSGFVNKSETECVKKQSCNNIGDINKSCNNYSTCVNVKDSPESRDVKCSCINDYISKNEECIPKVCNNIQCYEGFCIKNSANNLPACSCYIGFKKDPANNDKCTIKGDTECKLKCENDEECEVVDRHYVCVPKTSTDGDNSNNGPDSSSYPNSLSFFIVLCFSVIIILVLK